MDYHRKQFRTEILSSHMSFGNPTANRWMSNPAPQLHTIPSQMGQTEWVNQTLEEYFRTFVNCDQNDWYYRVSLAEFAYNNAEAATTKIADALQIIAYTPGRQGQSTGRSTSLFPNSLPTGYHQLPNIRSRISKEGEGISPPTLINNNRPDLFLKSEILSSLTQGTSKPHIGCETWHQNHTDPSRSPMWAHLLALRIWGIDGTYFLYSTSPYSDVIIKDNGWYKTRPIAQRKHRRRDYFWSRTHHPRQENNGRPGIRQRQNIIYLVKWLGFPDDYSSAEPVEMLQEAAEVVPEFHLVNPGMSTPSGRGGNTPICGIFFFLDEKTIYWKYRIQISLASGGNTRHVNRQTPLHHRWLPDQCWTACREMILNGVKLTCWVLRYPEILIGVFFSSYPLVSLLGQRTREGDTVRPRLVTQHISLPCTNSYPASSFLTRRYPIYDYPAFGYPPCSYPCFGQPACDSQGRAAYH